MGTDLSFPLNTYYIASASYCAALVCRFVGLVRLALFFLVAGFVVHLASDVMGRYIVWPYCNMFYEPFFLPLCLSGLAVGLLIRKRQGLALSMLPIIVGFAVTAVVLSESYYPPFTVMSRSIFAHLFHLFIFIAHGILICAAYLSLVSLLNRLRGIDFNQLVMWGFVFLCMAGLCGTVWSYLGRGDTVSWNHYYFHSIGIWFYYAGYLHLHLMRKWSDRRKALVLLGGVFLIIWLDYLPQIGGLHGFGLLDGKIYELY